MPLFTPINVSPSDSIQPPETNPGPVFLQERIQIHEAAVKEAERQASESLHLASKEHNTKLQEQAANLACLQKQAAKHQLKLTAKDAQLADVQSRLDAITAQLEAMQHAAKSSAEPQQALAAKDAQIAELDSKVEAAMSYRKKCVSLTEECKQLRDQLQSLGGRPLSLSKLETGPSPTASPIVSGDIMASRPVLLVV